MLPLPWFGLQACLELGDQVCGFVSLGLRLDLRSGHRDLRLIIGEDPHLAVFDVQTRCARTAFGSPPDPDCARLRRSCSRCVGE